MNKRVVAIIALVVALATTAYLSCRPADANATWFERAMSALHDIACGQQAPVIGDAPPAVNQVIAYVHDAVCRPRALHPAVDAGIDDLL